MAERESTLNIPSDRTKLTSLGQDLLRIAGTVKQAVLERVQLLVVLSRLQLRAFKQVIGLKPHE